MIWTTDRDGNPLPADAVSTRLSFGMVAAVVIGVALVALAFNRQIEARPDLEDAAIRQNIEAGREAMR